MVIGLLRDFQKWVSNLSDATVHFTEGGARNWECGIMIGEIEKPLSQADPLSSPKRVKSVREGGFRFKEGEERARKPIHSLLKLQESIRKIDGFREETAAEIFHILTPIVQNKELHVFHYYFSC